MSAYDALKSVDAPLRRFGRREVQRASRRLAWVDVATDDMSTIAITFAAMIIVLGLLEAPIIAASLASPPATGRMAIAMLAAYVALLLFGFLTIPTPARHLIKANLVFAALCWYGISVMLAIIALVAASRGHTLVPQTWANYSLIAFAIAVLIINGGVVLLVSIASALNRLWIHASRLGSPVATILSGLIDVLSKTEIYEKASLPLSTRNYVLSRIEEIAVAFEEGLPRIIETSDSNSDRWCRDTAAGLASRLRSEKHIFALGNISHDPKVVGRFSHYLQAAILGNWLTIETMEPSRQSKRAMLRHVFRLLEGVLIAVFPGVILVLIWDRLALTSPLSQYVKVGAFAWGVATLALTWDPAFAARLLSVRKLASSVGKE